jgi:hypothetical protein
MVSILNTPSNPAPDEIRAARNALGITQEQAGAVIYCTGRAWRQYELGGRQMHPAFWELFRIKMERIAPTDASGSRQRE